MIGTAAALLVRDFVNTRNLESGADELATPATLVRWLAGRGLLPANATTDAAADAGVVGDGELRVARALREGLRAALAGRSGRGAGTAPAALEEVLAELPVRVSMAGGRPALEPVEPGVRGGLARLAAAVAGTIADGSWARLKVCQEATCRWAFVDTSKNRSRTWCSMRVCGNRTKTRAYRARRTPP